MVHIVFNEADIKVLQEAISLDETLSRRCNTDQRRLRSWSYCFDIYETEGYVERT
jgi:hypothetical protein